jgi:hypothetical protein
VQATVRGTISDRPFANVFAVAPSGDVDPVAQALAILDAYVAELLPHLCNDVQVRDAAFVDLVTSSGATGTVTPTLPATLHGGVNAPDCPPNTTYLVRWNGVSARGVRNGRSYIPGVREDEVANGGIISDATVATMQTASQAFYDAVLANAGGPLVTIHTPSGEDASVTEIVSPAVEQLVATQRRRLRS